MGVLMFMEYIIIGLMLWFIVKNDFDFNNSTEYYSMCSVCLFLWPFVMIMVGVIFVYNKLTKK